jgi:hypothetical protein
LLEGEDLKHFLKELKKYPDMICPISSCPFGIVWKYWQACPDLFGAEREEEIIENPTLMSLPFFRALTSTGLRSLTKSPLGINMFTKHVKMMNSLLPTDLTVDKPTGHSGRHSLTTNATEAGCDANIISASTKHKDPKSLKSKYFIC